MLAAHPGWVARLQERCGWQDQPSTDYGSNACRQCKNQSIGDLQKEQRWQFWINALWKKKEGEKKFFGSLVLAAASCTGLPCTTNVLGNRSNSNLSNFLFPPVFKGESFGEIYLVKISEVKIIPHKSGTKLYTKWTLKKLVSSPVKHSRLLNESSAKISGKYNNPKCTFRIHYSCLFKGTLGRLED